MRHLKAAIDRNFRGDMSDIPEHLIEPLIEYLLNSFSNSINWTHRGDIIKFLEKEQKGEHIDGLKLGISYIVPFFEVSDEVLDAV